MAMETHEDGIPLQEWAMAHQPKDGMLFKESFWHQILFVRDTVSRILRRFLSVYGESDIRVVACHISKSIVLPVYSIKVGGIEIRMRDNFEEWKVSVKSDIPIPAVFPSFVKRDVSISPCYFEGFEREWVFGSYNNDPKKFSVEIYDSYDLFVFLTTILDAMRTK